MQAVRNSGFPRYAGLVNMHLDPRVPEQGKHSSRHHLSAASPGSSHQKASARLRTAGIGRSEGALQWLKWASQDPHFLAIQATPRAGPGMKKHRLAMRNTLIPLIPLGMAVPGNRCDPYLR